MFKQHFAINSPQTLAMSQSPTNQALAENLSYYMQRKGLVQKALAEKCGVAQTTISLYLHPERRKPGKDGKPGSAKLTEVEMLADALMVEPWQLVRPMTEGQRQAYEQIEAAYRSLSDRVSSTPKSKAVYSK
jgi:transcriptional regulator with XRE-family HTH domain